MKWLSRVFEYLLIAGLCAVLGFVGGHAYGEAVVSGAFVDWEPVPLPQNQEAQRFVAKSEPPHRPSVFIMTKEDRLFVHHLDYDNEEDTWEKVDYVNTEQGARYGECSRESLHHHLQISQPPDTPIAQLDCEVFRGEPIDSYRYVILENDAVWRWKQRGLGLGAVWVQLQYSFGFAILGALLGPYLYSIFLSRKNHLKQVKSSASIE